MKRNSQRVLMGAIILLIAFVLIAYMRGNKPEADTIAPAEQMASVGDTVTVGDVSYVIESVSEAAEYNGEKTDNKFVIVTLSADNNGKKEAEVYSELFYLYDSADREYAGDVKRDSGNSAGYFGYGDAIAPGLTKSGTVAFEVSADASGFKFAISDSMIATKSTNYVYVDLR